MISLGRPRRRTNALASVVLAAVVAVGSCVVASGPSFAAEQVPTGDQPVSAAAYGANLSIVGKGFGHGRGLSQYGSYGYAVERNYDWNRILDTYYPNTSPGTADVNATISTRLDSFGDVPAIVMHDGGRLTVGTYAPNAPVPGEFTAVMVRKNTVNPTQLDVYTGSGCDPNAAGAWTLVTTVSPTKSTPLATTNDVPARVTFDATGRNDADTNLANLIAVCEPDGQKRWYRGSFLSWMDLGNVQRLANVAPVEQYLRGVVPRESPASWGDAGGGKGLNALKAQTVAARSYALSESRYLPYAQTCDTQNCQVYGGAAVASSPAAALTRIEFDTTDRAVAETAGVVRLLNGTVARAEFSSSTGGWTAGGTFPSIEDLGDATSINPNYNWQTTLARSTVEQRYPQLGTLLLVNVTKRNGIGQFGGRVTNVELRGTNGIVSLLGDDMRRIFGLKSDWFFVAPPFTDTPVTAVASAASGGYWMATTEGGVYNFGTAAWAGSMSGQPLNSPVIGMAASGQKAYWLLGRDGGIFSFGGAAFYGSTGNLALNKPVVAMAARPQSDGYWFVASDGGIFAYGGAGFFGSMGGTVLNKPVVGMAPTSSGKGYWLVASDGGIFAFGDAQFFGSTGSIKLVQPIVGMAARPQGDGYWFVAADGGVFSFGAAGFFGSAVGAATSPVVAISSTPSGNGYRIVTAGGNVFNYGDAS